MAFKKVLCFALLCLCSYLQINAQFTATWALTTNASGAVTGTQAALVNVSAMLPGSSFTANGGYSNNGYKCQPQSTPWAATKINGFHLDFPFTPNGADVTLNSLSAGTRTSGSSGINVVALAYEVDNNGLWNAFSTPQNITSGGSGTLNISSLGITLYNNHNYVVRLYIYAQDSTVTSSSRSVSLKTVVFTGTASTTLASAPIVSTVNTASNLTKYSADLSGTITYPSTPNIPISQSGICWDLNPNPTIALVTKSSNGPTSAGTINANASGLNPATTYHFRAYAITPIGVIYGSDATFTTLSPTIPIVATNNVVNIKTLTAQSGGVISDSGGATIIRKGVCWATATNPTVNDNLTNEGPFFGNGNFTSFLNSLQPNTTYHVRAFAENSIGIAYGNDIAFKTLNQPTIACNPTLLNFGNVAAGTTSSSLSFILQGFALSPANGTIQVNAPAGYSISTSATGPYTNTLSVNYSAGKVTQLIYVKFSPTTFGNVIDSISFNGGGVAAADVITAQLKGTGSQPAGTASNTGTDFWTGFGYVQQMKENRADMSVYVAAGAQDVYVTVEIPGIPSYTPQTIFVQANTVQEITGFPRGDLGDNTGLNTSKQPDARLFYTGVSKRGIHVFSANGVPFSMWTHTYQPDNSESGCLNFPTNTWNSAYTVQSFGGKANNSYVNNSYFFVIAQEDNTVVTINPSNDIIDSSNNTVYKNNTNNPSFIKYPKGVPFTVTLNKGEVFNAMSVIDGDPSPSKAGLGALDLSGTTISTSCDKKIAVFGGNGRCLVDTSTSFPQTISGNSGSDHIIQQMFPIVAWGTKYLTVPTKTMAFNFFRIYVLDTATVVSVNGQPLAKSSLINNLFYQISGNDKYLIEASKPISVNQFIVSGALASNPSAGRPPVAPFNASQIGNNGAGDPEMIILSPVQQAVNNVTVASPMFKNSFQSYGGAYINVVIKKQGVASFKLDNSNRVDTGASSFTDNYFGSASDSSVMTPNPTILVDSAFQPFPYDTTYYYATLKVPYGAGVQHTLTSNTPFTAIAYGMARGVSYGFNAGTNLKNLVSSAPVFIQNTYGGIQTTNPTTCLAVPFKFSVALPYRTDTLWWLFNGNPLLNPVGTTRPASDIKQVNPKVDSIYLQGSDSFYIYRLKDTAYTFQSLGNYPIRVVGYNKNFISYDPCASRLGNDTFPLVNIRVVEGVKPDFKLTHNVCAKDTVLKFFDLSTDVLGYKINQWNWSFGFNSKKDTVQNPTQVYSKSGTYPVTLRAIDELGCYWDTTKQISLRFKPKASFTTANDTICTGNSNTYTSTSTPFNAGANDAITQWNWNYGNGNSENRLDSAARVITYNAATNTNVTLVVVNAVGCSDTAIKPLVVQNGPVADFTHPSEVCEGNPFIVKNTTTGANASTQYIWNWGDNSKPDTIFETQHIFSGYGPFNVSLLAKSPLGCSATKVITFDALYGKITMNIGDSAKESFEAATNNSNPDYFPPVALRGQRWHITQQPVDNTTWKRVVNLRDNIVASDGNAAATVNTFNYSGSKQKDELNTPIYSFVKHAGVYDSLFLKLDIAAKTKASVGQNDVPDTLEVLATNDCGQSWTSIYKKWGKQLQTVKDGSELNAQEFIVNKKSYWRTDSVNITANSAFKTLLQTGGDIRFKFSVSNQQENNIYIDNIKLYTIRPAGQGFITTGIPFDSVLQIIHNYPPANLKSISIFDMAGRLYYHKPYSNDSPNPIVIKPGINMNYFAVGQYVCVLEYTDKPKVVFKFLRQ